LGSTIMMIERRQDGAQILVEGHARISVAPSERCSVLRVAAGHRRPSPRCHHQLALRLTPSRSTLPSRPPADVDAFATKLRLEGRRWRLLRRRGTWAVGLSVRQLVARSERRGCHFGSVLAAFGSRDRAGHG
jgi:hypothetical protein